MKKLLTTWLVMTMVLTGAIFTGSVSAASENVCLGKKVTTNIAARNNVLPVAAITDGTYNGSQTLGSGIFDRYVSIVNPGKELVVTIDLAAVYNLEKADIVNRYTNGSGVCASYFKVETGLTGADGIAWTTVTAQASLLRGADGGYPISPAAFDSAVNADKLRVTFVRDESYTNTSNTYEVAEIMAYGTYVGEIYKETNVLLGSHVETSTVGANAQLKESNMVDGDNQTWQTSRFCPQSKQAPLTATFRLDGNYALRKFVIYERISGGTAITTASDKTDIYVGTTTNGVTAWTKVVDGKSLETGKAGAILATTFTLDEAVSGDSVRVVFDRKAQDYTLNYNIIEVEGYGDKTEEAASYVKSVTYASNGATLASAPKKGEFDVTVAYEGISPEKVIVALYSSDGKLLGCEMGEPGSPISFNVSSNIQKIKVLSWEGTDNLKPVLYSWQQWVY